MGHNEWMRCMLAHYLPRVPRLFSPVLLYRLLAYGVRSYSFFSKPANLAAHWLCIINLTHGPCSKMEEGMISSSLQFPFQTPQWASSMHCSSALSYVRSLICLPVFYQNADTLGQSSMVLLYYFVHRIGLWCKLQSPRGPILLFRRQETPKIYELTEWTVRTFT